MRTKALILSIFTVICMLACISPVSASTDNLIPVKNITDLQNISSDLSGSYILMNDINCAGTDLQPVFGFTGTFYGNGYTLQNLKSTGGQYQDAGLFDFASGANISNLNLTDVDFDGSMAGLVCNAFDCTINNCSITGEVTGDYTAGGIAGMACNSNIENCYSGCRVNSPSNAGGIAGFVTGTEIANCRFNGDIASGNITGGIAGYFNSGVITQCAAGGSINGSFRAGGIAGYNGADISNSYFIGSIAGTGDAGTAGGVAGYNSGVIDKCYAVPVMKPGPLSGGLVGYNYNTISDSYLGIETGSMLAMVGSGNIHTLHFANPKNNPPTFDIQSGFGTMTGCDFFTSSALKNQSVFTGWDFVSTWQISPDINDGYPDLRSVKVGVASGTQQSPEGAYKPQSYPNVTSMG